MERAIAYGKSIGREEFDRRHSIMEHVNEHADQ
jgi:hypothetical protein